MVKALSKEEMVRRAVSGMIEGEAFKVGHVPMERMGQPVKVF